MFIYPILSSSSIRGKTLQHRLLKIQVFNSLDCVCITFYCISLLLNTIRIVAEISSNKYIIIEFTQF